MTESSADLVVLGTASPVPGDGTEARLTRLEQAAARREKLEQHYIDRLSKLRDKTTEAVIELGRVLIEARTALGMDAKTFNAWAYEKLGLYQSDTSKHWRIAESVFITDNSNLNYLPSSPTALYEMSRIDHDTLDQARALGLITKGMRISDVKALPLKVRQLNGDIVPDGTDETAKPAVRDPFTRAISVLAHREYKFRNDAAAFTGLKQSLTDADKENLRLIAAFLMKLTD